MDKTNPLFEPQHINILFIGVKFITSRRKQFLAMICENICSSDLHCERLVENHDVMMCHIVAFSHVFFMFAAKEKHHTINTFFKYIHLLVLLMSILFSATGAREYSLTLPTIQQVLGLKMPLGGHLLFE